jgi:hypothetical protein
MLKEQCGSRMVNKNYVGFFFLNHKKNVDVKCPQTMRCIICYNSLVWFCNLKTQAKKNLIIYYTTNEIITLKKMCMQTILLLQKCLRSK